MLYHSYAEYLVRKVRANIVDPDQTPLNAASDVGLQCLPIILQFLHISTERRTDLLRVYDKYGKELR